MSSVEESSTIGESFQSKSDWGYSESTARFRVRSIWLEIWTLSVLLSNEVSCDLLHHVCSLIYCWTLSASKCLATFVSFLLIDLTKSNRNICPIAIGESQENNSQDIVLQKHSHLLDISVLYSMECPLQERPIIDSSHSAFLDNTMCMTGQCSNLKCINCQ